MTEIREEELNKYLAIFNAMDRIGPKRRSKEYREYIKEVKLVILDIYKEREFNKFLNNPTIKAVDPMHLSELFNRYFEEIKQLRYFEFI
jgi:predicted protein tyrosine phosphatase